MEVPSGDKGGEISVFCQLLAVAFDIFNEILDNPSADYRVIRYDQDGDNGVDPSAEGQPFGFAEGLPKAPTGLLRVMRPRAVSAMIME